MTTVLGVLILVCALFLIISVLLQSSKNHRMSGVVSGGADTFFGKQKGKTIDAVLSKATAVISIIFCILILVLYIITAKAAKVDNTVDPNAGITDPTVSAPVVEPADEPVEGGAVEEENAEEVPAEENKEEAPVEENKEEVPAEAE